ncbi:MAG: ABC transporter permease subunit [Bacillota bacterium]|nr:ABC transporter permease subunit [Bacillota bacterium]MDP4154144.1 ABC transporter permease subunit [Bacillota bacterium]
MLRINKKSHSIYKYKGLLGLLPALLFMLFFFIGGTLQSIYISLSNDTTNFENKSSLSAYKELINITFIHSLGITTGIAAVTAIVSGTIGLFVAVYLAARSYKWKWLTVLFQLPMGIPHLLAAYLLMQVLMQSGWYARIAYHLGLIHSFEKFPILVNDNWSIGILLAYMWKEVPFIIMLIFPFASKLLLEWDETSKSLGASFKQTILLVILPILMPLWVGGMWVIFAFALGAYEIPAIMGRTALGSVPVLAWQEYTQFGLDRQPVAIAMNLALAVISFLVGALLIYLQVKWYNRGRRVW